MPDHVSIDLDTPIGRVYDALRLANAALCLAVPLAREHGDRAFLSLMCDALKACQDALWTDQQRAALRPPA